MHTNLRMACDCVCFRVFVCVSASLHVCRYVCLLRVVVCLLWGSRMVVGCCVQFERIIYNFL